MHSYLSVIVASSGDRFLRDTNQAVSLALRGGPSSRPVETASKAIRQFATAELRGLSVPGHVAIAGVEDYLANATADLLMMGAWTSLPDAVAKEEMPLYYFARDDRLYSCARSVLCAGNVLICRTGHLSSASSRSNRHLAIASCRSCCARRSPASSRRALPQLALQLAPCRYCAQRCTESARLSGESRLFDSSA